MRKIVYIVLLLVSSLVFSQNKGITYQAVIYAPGGQNIPGVNVSNVPMANKAICLEFSFLDANSAIEYEEVVRTTTDAFGMVNITIGSGNQTGGYASSFAAITWSATANKTLKVALDPTGLCSQFEALSSEVLSSVPFANAANTATNVSGVVALVNGGTGATTAVGARTNLGLGNVENTSDLNKPMSTATKTYVDSQIVSSTIPDATTTSKGKIQLAGDLAGTATVPTVPGLALKANATDLAAEVTRATAAEALKAPLASPTFTGTVSGITKTMVGLGNVDNTTDANKPVSTATQTALDLKENLSNKSTNITADAASTTKYPAVKTIKDYVDTAIAGATIADATATNKGKIQLAGDLGGTAAAPTVPGLALKANTTDVTTSLATKENTANKSTDTTLASNSDVKFPTEKAVKTYVDTAIAGATIADATATNKGKIQLAGDLGGTAAAPTVPGLALKLDASLAGVPNGLATLNSSGIIPASQLPPVSVASTTVVASQAQMLALSTATVGSVAVRTDINKNFILSAAGPSVAANWIELLTPGAPVQSVNGMTGAIQLSKSDINLANVDNTSDAAKPISTATQNALNLKLDTNQVGVPNGAASLNALGKIPTSQIPAISFSSVKVLGSQSEMLALSNAVIGSVVIRTDVNKNYVLAQSDPAILANWVELLTPAPPVQSVNGYVGSVALTKADIGLANVDNTGDINKPVSIATQTALDLKADLASPTFTGTVSGITKTMVGLSNVNNTSDLNKPVSTATQMALDLKANTTDLTTEVNRATGAEATLTTNLATNATAITAETTRATAAEGTLTTNLAAEVTRATAAEALKAPLASPTFTGTVSGITKSMVGLGNVDNTTDANKPVSTATQTALDLKAPLASPAFTGTVSGITKSMVGLGNVDNTTDANKPVSTAQQTALDLKENLSNKSTDITADAASTTKYPSVKLIKDYVDALNAAAGVADGSITYAKIQNVASGKVLGNFTGSAGVVQELATTGSGDVVRVTSPTLVTPTLGVATATSVNKVTITAPTTSATLTIADGKTLTVSADATVSGTNTGDQTITLTGDVTGTGTGSFATTIGTGKVTTATIAANAVTTAKIADANVTNAKLDKANIPLSGFGAAAADVALGSNKLTGVANPTAAQDAATKSYVDTSVAAATIADADATTKGKLQLAGDLTGTAAAPAVAAGAITTTKIADTAVTSAKIADATIVNADVATNAAIAYSKLDLANSIVAADITANAVETAKIKDANVTYAKIQNVSATDKVLGRVSAGAGIVEEIATTGSGNVVRATSPTLVTPTLGVATATSINGLTPTAQTTGFTIAGGTASKTLTVSGDATVSGTNTGDQTITLTGDVTGSGTGSFAATIGTGKVTTATIAADAVTSAKILDGTIVVGDLADNAVETAKIKAAAVTNAKLDKANIPLSGFGAAAADVALGANKLTGVADPTLAQDAATKSYVDTATGAITTLADGKIYLGNASNVATEVTPTGDVTITNAGVTAIGTGKVVTAMLADTAVTTAKITDANVTTVKLAADAVTSAKITDGTIVVGDLADNAVETAKIKDANITYAKIQNVSATDKVLGRVSAGAGIVEEIATTGSGNVVRATSPTLVTPVLGVATATSINGTTIPSSKTIVVTTDKISALSATTSAELAGVISDETGTGALVMATSPTLVTPTLGVATATSINGLTPTAAATGFTIAGGTASKTLTVSGDATVSGTNTGDQTITLTGDVTGTGTGSFATTIGAAKVTNAMLAGSIDLTSKVTGILPIANGGTGSSSQNFVDLTTAQTVAGAKTFSGNTAVSGTSTFTVGTGATALGGTLGVTGATTLSSTLAVTGNTTVGGTTTLNGNTSVSGSNTLTVGTGATSLGGTLGVTGATTLSSTLAVSGNTTVGGTTTLNGNTSVSGSNTLTVGTGATALGGTLGVTGATTLSSTLGVTGDVTVNTDKFKVTASSGNTEIAGTLKVAGGSPGAGKVLTSDANGLASWNSNPNTALTTVTAATYTVATTDKYVIYSNSAAGTITLPDATSSGVGKGKEFIIKNITAFVVTVNTTSSQKIVVDKVNDAATTATLGVEASNNWIRVISDGAQWIAFRALF